MLVKSNSVPNFLFETTQKSNITKKQYHLKLANSKLISYSEFIKNNPNASRKQRQNAIKNFYDKLLHQ
jgi:hypothetical protein